jgi:hypothetical protein
LLIHTHAQGAQWNFLWGAEEGVILGVFPVMVESDVSMGGWVDFTRRKMRGSARCKCRGAMGLDHWGKQTAYIWWSLTFETFWNITRTSTLASLYRISPRFSSAFGSVKSANACDSLPGLGHEVPVTLGQ